MMTLLTNTKIRNSMIALGVSAIAMTTMAVSADAGGNKNHRHFHKGWAHHHVHHDHHFSGCWRFKRKYYRTGRKFWLKKYYACKLYY